MDIQYRKAHLDGSKRDAEHALLADRVSDLGARYVAETVKWISASLNPSNFTACKQRLLDVIQRCRAAGFVITPAREDELVAQLKAEYQRIVRVAFQREEQARIKTQIREEQLREREVERELKQLEHERAAIKATLEKALADANNQRSEEVDRLKRRLAEAEEKAQRAVSQAQLTKSGHVYVISNIGSFGDGVFKVGMTRRLEPLDRIRELGDASVPFPFDVHMMISCDDAPTLENALHRKLFKHKVNRTNPRKEFFRTDIHTICAIVKEHHGDVEFVADAEALEYRESLAMPDEDQDFIEGVFDDLEDEGEIVADNA